MTVMLSRLLHLIKLSLKILHSIEEQSTAIQSLEDGQKAITAKLDQILTVLISPPVDHIVFRVDLEGQITDGASSMTLNDSQQAVLTIQAKDKKGNPTTVTGVPTWASSDATVCTVDASGDPTGMTATLKAVAPGSARVTADDIEAGGVDATGTLDVTVTAGAAVSIEISAGTPTDQA